MSKQPKNVQFFGGVLVQRQKRNLRPQPRTHAGGASGTDGSQVICSSQILAGRQKIFRSGWQADSEIVESVTLAITFSTQLLHHNDDTAPYLPIGSPSLTASFV